MTQYIVDTGPEASPLRMRTRPSARGTIVAYHAAGQIVDVIEVKNGWAKLSQTVGGKPVTSGARSDGYLYADARYLRQVGVPVVVPPSPNTPHLMTGAHPAMPALARKHRIGIHCFEYQHVAARWESSGCKLFTVMDVGVARELRSRGHAVFYRKFGPHGARWTPRQHVDASGLTRDDRLIYLGLNERDLGYATPAERGAWDRGFCDIVLAEFPHVIPAICGEAMGNPGRLETQEVQDEMRRAYAWIHEAKYRDRVVWNYHSYERRPTAEFPGTNNTEVISTDWLGMRHHKFLFDKGILPSWLVMISDEWGIDVGGTGGFPAMNYQPGDLNRLFSFTDANLLARPNVYGVTAYAGATAQERPDWAPYSVEYLRGTYAQRWAS